MAGNSSSDLNFYNWFKDQECFGVFTALFVCYILLVPLFILVLYVGFSRWRKQRSEQTSHSDVFTYNMVTMELIGVLGSCFFIYGLLRNHYIIVSVGMLLWALISPGQNFFHILTCVERYLAVVYPITYLRLRQSGGVRIRNIIIGCVWLICFGSLYAPNRDTKISLDIISSILSFIVVCFCSLSVLCVLIHPGPGDAGGNKNRVDPSKKRAFQTITIIFGALILRFSSTMFNTTLGLTLWVSRDYCIAMWSAGFCILPSSLVLPLLFLHRVGKLPSCKANTESV